MRNNRFLLICSLLFLIGLSACGGGSSSDSDSAPPPTPPTPTVTLSVSSESVEVNTEFNLAWSTINADTCTASGSWSGDKASSGSEIITEVQIGTKGYTISCSGAGGQVSSSVEVEITSLTNTDQWDHVHIPYGTDDPNRQWLNIHLAYDQSTPMPIYLLAHGNGGSADGVSENELHALANEGYATISWESIPTISNSDEGAIGIADAQVMFEWVIANADTYNLDPDHIVVGGRSRGSIISWQLAHSNHPSIKGIYMYNALPQSAWQDVGTWSPVDEITIDSPVTYLVYGPDFDDDDGHNPVNVDPLLARYDELGIGDKITRHVDMWGDFRGDNGGWTNDAHTMHYFAEFAAQVEETIIPHTLSRNTLFMGHSFFAPIARQIPVHMTQLGNGDHSQHVESSPGETGTPIALWEDEGHRNTVQAILDTGEVELFGMTASPTMQGYTLWIDYALSTNPNTRIVIGTPWLDFPANYSDAAIYENTIIDGIDSKIQVDIDALRLLYPNTEIINLPYAFAAIQLRNMFEAEQLPGVTELIGSNPETSIFRDEKGHGHGNGLLLDLAEFIWLRHIYGIDLDSYEYSAGHDINLKEIAKSILDKYAYYFEPSTPIIQKGKITKQIEVNGITREYIIYVPENYTRNTSQPLLMSFHGLTGNMELNYGNTKFNEQAESNNFIAVHPNGLSNRWTLTADNNADVDFIQALLDEVEKDFNIDSNRIYSTGMSMGGFFSFHLACKLSDRIAAIASVTGSMYQHAINDCSPSKPMPILQIHGTEDDIVDYSSIAGLLDFWTNHNNTEITPVTSNIPDVDAEDGSTVERLEYLNGDQGVEVHHLKITGGGHDWAGFRGNMDINATEEVWNFVKDYDLDGKIE
ncbi:alpha/beta hydrolase-fold protein [Glaciecola petra]|uniref:Alpha/beta hydrolase-fold protein n=1 Tax=Glaciecola petra TaxID=3075602 RepID=A0ABU2ZT77_9ALTE|nr:dienelactone hydrolase family protein [Aestuariibacter sp. P117]MDT0595238.1 alpha/beta hydrolase-fold protein [Aestuariibacter sp. P117]